MNVSCSTPPETQVSHFVVARRPDRHLAFPDVCLVEEGELLVVYREGHSHVDASGRIMMSRGLMVEGSAKFSPPQVVVDTDLDDRDPSICQLANGTLLLSFFRLDIKRKCQVLALTRSDDGGRTWEPVLDIPVPNFPIGLATSDAIVELPSGALLMPVYGKLDTGEEGSFVLTSLDHGTTWSKIVPLALQEHPIFEEPALCRLSTGRLVAFLRTDHKGLGYVYETHSDDDGDTWEVPRRLNVWGYPPDVVEMKNGRLLLTYGYRQLPTGIRYCVSPPDADCSIWDEQILRCDGHDEGELGYPASVELRDGTIVTVYYFTEKEGGVPHIAGSCFYPTQAGTKE